jgi:endogenous inhibitor of DNA gyrase (YacG/DUF329 family)
MSAASDKSPPVRVVNCPACDGRSLYSPDNPYRPFCSARCKGIDLGAWASEQFRLKADPPVEGQDGDDSNSP